MSWTPDYVYALFERMNNIESFLRDIRDELCRPSIHMRPELFIDGDKWCVLCGEDLQNGVAGFGDTPDEAMRDFDRNFKTFTTGKQVDGGAA